MALAKPQPLQLAGRGPSTSRFVRNYSETTSTLNDKNGQTASDKAQGEAPPTGLTGAAKLMAEALVEEEGTRAKEKWRERSEQEAASSPYVIQSCIAAPGLMAAGETCMFNR